MKILQLDFNRKASVIPWLGLLLTALGVITVLWVMAQIDLAKEHKNQIELREDEIALRLKQRESKVAAELNASPVSAKVEKIRRDQMLNNDIAFNILEQAWGQKIAFTRLEIATVERDIKIDLEAKALNDVLLLVDRLQAQSQVKQVSLARNSIKIGDPQLPAVAAMEVFWLLPDAASAVASASVVAPLISKPSQPAPSLNNSSRPVEKGMSR